MGDVLSSHGGQNDEDMGDEMTSHGGRKLLTRPHSCDMLFSDH
nr:MAG TPA: hypothetical protein [Caudoviricetes sp.]